MWILNDFTVRIFEKYVYQIAFCLSYCSGFDGRAYSNICNFHMYVINNIFSIIIELPFNICYIILFMVLICSNLLCRLCIFYCHTSNNIKSKQQAHMRPILDTKKNGCKMLEVTGKLLVSDTSVSKSYIFFIRIP